MATAKRKAKDNLDVVVVITEKVVTFEVENPYWDSIKELAAAIVAYNDEDIPDEATVEVKDTSIVVTWVEKNVRAGVPDA